jgi:hypothetical protein
MRLNGTQKTGIFSKIASFFRRRFRRQTHSPQVVQSSSSQQQNANPRCGTEENLYSEVQADISSLYGTSLNFGSQTTIEIDQYDRVKVITTKPSYILGSGRRISNIEEVAGICKYCSAVARKGFEEGLLTAEQAQLQSLFDIHSARRCSECGSFVCSVHCRSIETQNGRAYICEGCIEQIRRHEKNRLIKRLLLSPFTESREEN